MRRTIVLACAIAATLAAADGAYGAGVNCSDFSTQEQAQAYFDSHGGSPSNNVEGLDADHNGVACQNLPSGGTAATAAPAAAPASPSGTLPNNGAPETVMALVGVTLIEAGAALTLVARSRR